jgi:transcriptional regulator GlxA family with amidase domain
MTRAVDRLGAMVAAGRPVQVGILLFPDVEVLDFAGPFEVFSVADRIARRDGIAPGGAFDVATVAVGSRDIRARHGLVVRAAHDASTAPAFDLLVVPGGIVTQPLGDPETLAYLERASADATLTASVCTGAFLLAAIGLTDNRAVTTHWEDIGDLRAAHPGLRVVENVPFIDEDTVVTSAGISAGIGMSLHVVSGVLGSAGARATARQMQYDWEPELPPRP